MLKQDQGNGMTERGITTASRRMILSLPEAGAFLGCSVDDLLLKGARGELRICARVPKDAVPYSTNRRLIDLANPSLTGLERKLHEDHATEIVAQAVRDIQFVVLRKSDCASVVSQGEVYQTLFATGVRIGADGAPVVVEPVAPKEPADFLDCRPFRIFACYPRAVDPNNWAIRRTAAPVCLNLTLDALRILHADLVALETATSEPVRFDIGFVEEPHMPQTLVHLYEVAMAHWDCSRPGWAAPDRQTVERALKELDTYKGKQAKAGEVLLRWSFENWNQRHYDLRKADGKLLPFEALVVVASAWGEMGDSTAEHDNELVRYRDKATAFAFWESLGIKGYLAVFAWRIATPKSARGPGRRRKV